MNRGIWKRVLEENPSLNISMTTEKRSFERLKKFTHLSSKGKHSNIFDLDLRFNVDWECKILAYLPRVLRDSLDLRFQQIPATRKARVVSSEFVNEKFEPQPRKIKIPFRFRWTRIMKLKIITKYLNWNQLCLLLQYKMLQSLFKFW